MNKDIFDLESRRYTAMLAADTSALADLLSPDLLYTHSNGVTDSKAEYIDKVGKGVYRYLDLKRQDEKIRVFGDVALVTGRMVATVEVAGAPRHLNNKFLAVWLRQAGQWQFMAFQPTVMPAEPAAKNR